MGKPKDNDSRGCYVMLHIHGDSNIFSPESIKVEFIRFEYDIEEAARAVEESRLPDDYAGKPEERRLREVGGGKWEVKSES